jgi:hypothetical protein
MDFDPRIHTSLYTHVLPEGSTIHLWAEGMRHELLHMPAAPIHRIAVQASAFWHMHEIRAFDPLRCIELARRHPREAPPEPLLYCLWGNSHLAPDGGFLADGHHRYALAVVRGLTELPTWMVPEQAWRLFEIDGLPPMTMDELRDLKPTKRNY